MNRMTLCTLAVCFVTGLAGCSGGSSSGSDSTGPEFQIPEDYDKPDGGGVVEEVEEDGTDPGESFQGRRFFVEGEAHGTPGLWAVGQPEIIDEEALPERQFVTIPAITDNELAPYGVFYRTESDFRFAFTNGAPEDDATKTIAADADAKNSCLGPVAFDADTPDRTAVTYALLRDGEGNCVPADPPETQEWFWLAIGADDEDPPNPFEEGFLPRVGLRATVDNAPSWLVRDLGEDGELRRVFSDINGTTPAPITIEDEQGATVRLSAISPIAELGPDSFLVAKQRSDEAPLHIGHFDASDNTLTRLVLDSEPEEGIPNVPESNWVTVHDGTAYFALDNLLLRADANGVSVIDGVDPDSIESAQPLFVTTSDTHTLWGLRVETDEGTVRQVRVAEHGSEDIGVLLALAGYADAQVRGHADGWMYFTVADSAQSNGSLDSPLAVGINPLEESIFVLEDAHWVGSTLDREATGSFSDPVTAPINGLFFRSGSDLTRIGALIDPAEPLVDDTNEEGEPQTTLPVVTIGNLGSAFSAVSMGAGFGPDRLLTAIRVDDADVEDGGSVDPGADPVISSQVFRADPRQTQVTLDDESNEGSLVRALSLF